MVNVDTHHTENDTQPTTDTRAPVEWVDPFVGNGATNLPEPEGLASTWFWPKAQVGNTHPGPCYPFGMVSVCAYSGAYPTGYGLYEPTFDGQPERRFDRYMASGFTHFQHSGTGDIGLFYNYVKVTPLAVCRRKLSSQTQL